MGQEQSSTSMSSYSEQSHQHKHRHKDKREYSNYNYTDRKQYEVPERRKEHKKFKESEREDNSSNESSGYRSSSDRSSSSSDYYQLSLYKNEHYRDVKSNIYRPVKIPKDKLHKLHLLDVEKDTVDYLEKHICIKSYLQNTDKPKKRVGPRIPEPSAVTKNSGIRNYTPKILTEEDDKTKIGNWI